MRADLMRDLSRSLDEKSTFNEFIAKMSVAYEESFNTDAAEGFNCAVAFYIGVTFTHDLIKAATQDERYEYLNDLSAKLERWQGEVQDMLTKAASNENAGDIPKWNFT